jgi:hypothetical protein
MVKPPSGDVTLQVTEDGGHIAQGRSATPGPRHRALEPVHVSVWINERG